MTGLEDFHFLRPLWLLAIPAFSLLWWLIRRRNGRQTEVGNLIAPHLRDALIVNQDAGRGIKPVDGVMVAAIFLVLAASGPSWTRVPSPWFAETAPLVIALEVSDSMRSNDVQPTRLDRARFKILDLVATRTGARTAIIAYAGSAHIVVPPSSDIEVLKPLLESLDPAIMPIAGNGAASALPLTLGLLGDETARGSLLFINDGFAASDLSALAAFTSVDGNPGVTALVIGTDTGGVALLPDGSPVRGSNGGRLDTSVDTEMLRRVRQETGLSITRMRTDDGDLREVARRIESHLAQATDPDAQWQDQGWWLLWPAMLLMLAWFRRGWTMRW